MGEKSGRATGSDRRHETTTARARTHDAGASSPYRPAPPRDDPVTRIFEGPVRGDMTHASHRRLITSQAQTEPAQADPARAAQTRQSPRCRLAALRFGHASGFVGKTRK